MYEIMRQVTSFVLVMICLSLPYLGVAESYEAYLSSIDGCLKNRDWTGAERLITTTLKEHPANPNNYLLISNLGTIHRNLGLLQEALTDYNTALSIAPNSTTILHNRASLYLEMDSVKSAFEDYKKISALNENDYDAFYYMGIIAMEFGDMSLSKECLQKAATISNKKLDAQRALALWHKINGDTKIALSLYSEIIKKENRCSNYLNRAECRLDEGLLNEAMEDISEAQKLEPSNPEVYLLKARLSQLQFRYEDAANYAKQALQLGCDARLANPFIEKSKR